MDALSAAWEETLCLLFRPFQARRWIELSVVCVFLGGGTATAAFQWGFSILPGETQSAEVLLRLRNVIAQHLSLIILAVIVALSLGLALIYVRCVLRFVLVDTVMKREVSAGAAWRSVHTLGRTYFLWLVGVMATVAAGLGAAVLSFSYLNSGRWSDHPSRLWSWWLGGILAAVVLVGLMITVGITITDDLVVPLVYAHRGFFLAAWRKVWEVARHDSGTFALYLVMRFAVSIGIGVASLFLLFPVLISFSSVVLITVATINLLLRLMGLVWSWNALTMVLGATAMLVLSGLLFAILSVVGMPGQVYLQNYGVLFIASRHPPLQDFWRQAAAPSGRRLLSDL